MTRESAVSSSIVIKMNVKGVSALSARYLIPYSFIVPILKLLLASLDGRLIRLSPMRSSTREFALLFTIWKRRYVNTFLTSIDGPSEENGDNLGHSSHFEETVRVMLEAVEMVEQVRGRDEGQLIIVKHFLSTLAIADKEPGYDVIDLRDDTADYAGLAEQIVQVIGNTRSQA